MITVVIDAHCIHIPYTLNDLQSFQDWARSDSFPQAGQICFFNEEVWVDMTSCSTDRQSVLPVNRHDQAARSCNGVLAALETGEPYGYYCGGIYLTNKKLGFSVLPDGMMASMETIRRRIVHHKAKYRLELEFTPDMALEVVSASSVEKDTVTLRDLYWQAGIQEYWLVDVREDHHSFDILRHTTRGYTSVRKQGGWLKSAVFGKSFRLTRELDELGNPECTLRMR